MEGAKHHSFWRKRVQGRIRTGIKPVFKSALTARLKTATPIASLAALTGCAGPLSTLAPSGPSAASIAGLWWVMLAGSAVLFALVLVLFLLRLYKHSIVNVGAAAIEAISHIHADLYFMGVTGVHPTAGLSTGDLEEAYVKRALAARSAETVVLASTDKLNAASAYSIGTVTLAQTVVVERSTEAAFTDAMEAAGVSVVRA